MQFKKIIGQKTIKRQLIKTFTNKRISHAQMFVGLQGVGKLPLAIAYAQYISCLNKQNEDSCGTCSSCKKYQKLIHPDLHFVFPVIKNNSSTSPISDHYLTYWREQVLNDPYFNIDDWYKNIGTDKAQGLIYSQESNEITRKLNLKTYESEYKIMIIWLPEKMHQSAANKLLKMIEEPPAKTIILMISEEPNKILKTILSRTQTIKIPEIETDCLKNAIKKEYNLEPDETNNIARLAKGSYRQAQLLIKNSEENQFNFKNFIQIMRLCYARKISEVITKADEIAAIGRERQKSFLSYALKLVRENFILNLKQPEMVYLNNDEMDFSEKFSPFINQNNTWDIADELSRAYNDIQRNANAKIVFLDMALKLVKLLRK